jgi:DNA end-binding protein Ku
MPIRATATGTLTFGLVAIPVKFYLAVSAEDVRFNQITSDGHRVKQKLVDEVTGAEVERDSLLKGYEYAKGQFVAFTREEIEKLESASDKTIAIETFVPVTILDPMMVEKTYYLGPDKGGDRAYGIMVKALSETGRGALAQWSTRGREHLVFVRAYRGGLLLHTLYYADEIRNQAEVTDTVASFTYSPQEEELARVLIERMSAPRFDPSLYRDRYRERVLEAVNAKVGGKEIVVPVVSPAPHVIDLFEALKRSVVEAKAKAPETAQEAPREPKAPKGKGKGGKGKRGA